MERTDRFNGMTSDHTDTTRDSASSATSRFGRFARRIVLGAALLAGSASVRADEYREAPHAPNAAGEHDAEARRTEWVASFSAISGHCRESVASTVSATMHNTRLPLDYMRHIARNALPPETHEDLGRAAATVQFLSTPQTVESTKRYLSERTWDERETDDMRRKAANGLDAIEKSGPILRRAAPRRAQSAAEEEMGKRIADRFGGNVTPDAFRTGMRLLMDQEIIRPVRIEDPALARAKTLHIAAQEPAGGLPENIVIPVSATGGN